MIQPTAIKITMIGIHGMLAVITPKSASNQRIPTTNTITAKVGNPPTQQLLTGFAFAAINITSFMFYYSIVYIIFFYLSLRLYNGNSHPKDSLIPSSLP